MVAWDYAEFKHDIGINDVPGLVALHPELD
jgi:hypothetical protein